MPEVAEVLATCTNILPGHGREKPIKASLLEIADSLSGDELPDRYGQGEYIKSFESEMAEMFGKEAAVFLPSGTMAQQIALRVWCEQSHNFTVAMHPTAHLEFAEQSGYQFLHHIQRLQFGAPEFLRERILTVHDFEELSATPGVILLELPYRPLGGQLPPWDDLQTTSRWAHEHTIPMHLDGARIWQCRSFYQMDYPQIAELFDSLYISFYKDLGGMCGAMLLGSSNFIKQARLWQVRHGGRLFSMAPYLVSARMGLARVLPQIDAWVRRAREIAGIMTQFERITVVPDPPHVNMFRLYIRGDAEIINHRHLTLAQETGTFLFYGLSPTIIPEMAVTEVHCWENALAFDLSQLRPFLEKLLT